MPKPVLGSFLNSKIPVMIIIKEKGFKKLKNQRNFNHNKIAAKGCITQYFRTDEFLQTNANLGSAMQQ